MNFNDKFNLLTKEEREGFYQKARTLYEDMTFFKLYMNRNRKSNFVFDITISQGLCRRFLMDLWRMSYWTISEENVENFLVDYLIAEKFMESFDTESLDDSEKKKIYMYFFEYHNIKLEDYVSDFFGCSRECGYMASKISKLNNPDL